MASRSATAAARVAWAWSLVNGAGIMPAAGLASVSSILREPARQTPGASCRHHQGGHDHGGLQSGKRAAARARVPAEDDLLGGDRPADVGLQPGEAGRRASRALADDEMR